MSICCIFNSRFFLSLVKILTMKTTLLFLSVFLSVSLFGQIVFVDNFDGVYSAPVPPPSQYLDFPFDINSDGENDIELYYEAISGTSNCDGNPIGPVIHSVFFRGLSNVYGDNKVHCISEPVIGSGIDCNGDVLDLNDLWFESSKIHRGEFLNEPICYSVGYGNHKQGFRMLVPNPANGANAYIYGYIDYTLASSGDVIIHGWYYESQLNQPITVGEGTIGINELTTSKNLIQILDMMGRETSFKPNTPLIYVYDDGSTEKVFTIE